jgi:hypothetical protein
MARARKEVDEVPEGFADQVERDVRAGGAVALRKVKPAQVKLSRRAEAALFEQLARRGLERTASAVRVPLREQLAVLIERGEPIASASLRKQLRGVASAAELKLVAGDLIKAGRAALVVRSGKEHIAARSPALLSAAELAELAEVARSLAKLTSSTRSRSGHPARTLLRADAAAVVEAARRALGPDPARAPAAQAPAAPAPDHTVAGRDPVALVVAAARGRASPVTGLAYVPELARALDGRLDGDALRGALLRAARSGLVELRPESGIELLSAADADACPRGPDGSPLSWVRVVGREEP